MHTVRVPRPSAYELSATKGCWTFAIQVVVDNQRVPLYNIQSAQEGPEAWIPVEEGKEYAVTYTLRKNPNSKHAFLPEYPDFEGDQQQWRNGGRFEGRQLPKRRMRRIMFSKPHTTQKHTKANIERMGTIEVAFQRCDASHGEDFVNKETLPIKTLNQDLAREYDVDMVTSFGPVVPTTKIPTNVTGTIAPLDSDDFVSMQLRYVTMETLERLGYVQYEEQIVQSPPRPMVSAKNQRAAPIPKAREQPMASSRQLPQKILAPLVAPTPQVVGEVQGLIAAIATMNKTLMDKLHKLQNGAAAEVAIGFADLFGVSAAFGIMKSPLEDKLNLLAVTATTNRGMAPYGPAVEEVRDMAAAIFTMNKALQGKIKELQHGDVSGNVAGLRELEAMSNALRLMNDSMRGKLENVRMNDQDFDQEGSPEPLADDDRSARRVTAKRRKIQ